jgi:uncharacterized protein DUF4339
MTDSWYYAQGTDSVGPIDIATLVAILKRVSDPTDVLVWTRHSEEWRRVRDVPELAEILDPLPPLWRALPAVRKPEVSEAQKQKLPAFGATVVQGIAAAGNHFLFLAGIAAIWTLCMLYLYEETWVTDQLINYAIWAAGLAIVLMPVVVLPLALMEATKKASAFGLFALSYVFGTCMWMMGTLTAYFYWGFKGLMVGILLFGMGVVPIGLLAGLLNADWTVVMMIGIGVMLTYGARFGAFWLEAFLDAAEESVGSKMIDAWRSATHSQLRRRDACSPPAKVNVSLALPTPVRSSLELARPLVQPVASNQTGRPHARLDLPLIGWIGRVLHLRCQSTEVEQAATKAGISSTA